MKYLFIALLFSVRLALFAQCNGNAALCEKPYNEVAFLTTHNAYNCTAHNFSLPNQTWGITKQLQDGVRGLMIDVYDVNGVPTVYHGYSILGSQPLSFILEEIYSFMSTHPAEVVTVIFETYTTSAAIDTALNNAGLKPFLFGKQAGMPWPTLQTMIDSGKTLVVFSEKNDGNSSQLWYHYVWNYATETHFSVSDTSLFSCDFNRGNPSNPLYIFNHFITGTLGTGDPAKAEIANSNPFFINRVMQCMQQHNKFPNFITVDFYEKGNAFDVVGYLNSLTSTPLIQEPPNQLLVLPNPSFNGFNVCLPANFLPPFSYTVYDFMGNIIEYKSSVLLLGINIQQPINKGTYILLAEDSLGRRAYVKLIAL